jgi:hypothetical protein
MMLARFRATENPEILRILVHDHRAFEELDGISNTKTPSTILAHGTRLNSNTCAIL